MSTLARLIANRANAVVLVAAVGLLAVLGAMRAARVENDDNLLSFLPVDNADVVTFYDINERFGATDVALVGIETDDPFTADFLTGLQQVTRELREAGGLSHVITLTNVVDSVADEVNGGIITTTLVDKVPRTAAERAALAARVLSRESVVGNLISADGKAVLLYCFLASGTEPRRISEKIRTIVTNSFPESAIRWGGNPFVSSYVYDTVQRDLRNLSPWAVLVIVLLMLLSLRNLLGTLLALLASAASIAITLGLMQTVGVRLNLALGSMPIVLFAIGSTYAIHVVSRFFDCRQHEEIEPALQRTVRGIGPVVLATGATAAAAIASFVVMDIPPIRTFGLFTAIGIVVSTAVSLTFLPAAIRALNLGSRRGAPTGVLRRAAVRLAVFCQTRRRPVLVALALVLVVFSFLVTRVKTGVDQSSFFRSGSPPHAADLFLRDHFGAAQFLQILIEGDLRDPTVLLEVQSLADRLELLPHVTDVQHVGEIIAATHEAMTGHRRLPDTPGQVDSLFTFVIGDPAVAQMISDDRRQALLQVKVDTGRADEMDEVLDAIGKTIEEQQLQRYVIQSTRSSADGYARKRAALAVRLEWLAAKTRVTLPGDLRERLDSFLDADTGQTDPGPVAEMVRSFLRSAECAVSLPPPTNGTDVAAALAAALVALGPTADEETQHAAIARVMPARAGDTTIEDLALSVQTPVADAWRTQAAEQKAARLIAALAVRASDARGAERLFDGVTTAIFDLEHPSVLVPAPAGLATGHLQIQVNGLPVLHRGLAKSVKRNQLQSIFLAVFLVVSILSVMLGSLKSGVMASMPTLFTLVIIHGAMGLVGLNLDVGTSLLGSLILANGIDYAVHLIAAWETPPGGSLARAAACAADRAGPAIWTSAATMFVGFFVLSLGEARVLQVVTGLKAAAMLVGALSTFLVIPALARRWRYQVFNAHFEAMEPSAAVDAVLAANPPANR
jgi:predicted RND superfamily exporter protein